MCVRMCVSVSASVCVCVWVGVGELDGRGCDLLLSAVVPMTCLIEPTCRAAEQHKRRHR